MKHGFESEIGIVRGIENGNLYTVESRSRPGIIAYGLRKSSSEDIQVGDVVFFMLAPDGTGILVGCRDREPVREEGVLTQDDIINDLEHTDTDKVLGAGQGKALDDKKLDKTALIDLIYPVGSIYMSVNAVSPNAFLGGEWEQIQDTFLLAAGNAHAAGSVGGAESVSYTPGGSIGGHTLTSDEMPKHKHSIGAHFHGLNSHKHSIGAHAHGMNNHTHSYTDYYANGASGGPSNNTSGSTTLTANQSGLRSHNHVENNASVVMKTGSWDGQHGQWATFNANAMYSNSDNGTNWGIAGSLHAHGINYEGNWGAAEGHTHGLSSHTHGVTNTSASRTSGGNTGNTANSTAFDSGAASGNTANSTAFDSGEQGGSGSHDHGFTGTQATIKTMPPYMSVYMWRRTA